MKSQLTKRGRGRELAVVLHGPHGSPKEMQGVSKAIGERSEDLDLLVDLTRLLFPLSLCPLLRVTPWQRQNGPADTAIVNIVLAVMS